MENKLYRKFLYLNEPLLKRVNENLDHSDKPYGKLLSCSFNGVKVTRRDRTKEAYFPALMKLIKKNRSKSK